MAIGQCRSGGITVATVALAHGAEDVVLDNEISGGPPFDMGLTMSAPKKNKKNQLLSLRRIFLFFLLIPASFYLATYDIE